MEDSPGGSLEARLIQQWKEIEDLDENEAEDHFKSMKEQWFLEAFSFLRDLSDESHCWCGHKEIMLPLLEPFYSFFQETSSNSSLRVLWRRLKNELSGCTQCVVQHHKAKEFYESEFVEDVVKPLLDIIRTLDEERVAQQMKELLRKFDTDTLDSKDSSGVICIMFEVLMFPFLLDDAEINENMKPFLLHVEETHDLSLAVGQRYPGVYSLLLHTNQGVRRIALKLAHSLPTFKDEQDMESIQPMLKKCMYCLEYNTFDSSTQKAQKSLGTHDRPRAVFSKEALWLGLTTVLSVVEPPAFLKGVMEKYPVFVSVVLNHVSEASSVFWNALRCLKLLLEVLGYKLWLGTTFSPGVMSNTLLSLCFHSHEERMHVHIFDLFQSFLHSLEALQDGEYENQRRRLLYFLLVQVPLSSNFKPLMTKKARQVAFLIIGHGYTMDPPFPPVECVHVWGPPLVATLRDPDLIMSLKQPAVDLIQSIIIADAAALAAASTKQAFLESSVKYSLDNIDDDFDSAVNEALGDRGAEVVGDAKNWISFLSVTRSVEVSEQWFCLPLLWVEVLSGIQPVHLPSSFTKGLMWALGWVSLIDSEGTLSPNNLVVSSNGVACSKDMCAVLKWVKPKGYDDGAGGAGCVNAVNTASCHKELVGLLKIQAEKYLTRFRDGGLGRLDWVWEARMAEPCILLLLDANAIVREFGKEILRRIGNANTLEACLEFLCSCEVSACAAAWGLYHALKLLLHWPLTQCSRGLQQLFFHVWKLLTLGDKDPERPTTQISQDGGFLNKPKFDTLNDVPVSPFNGLQKDETVWRKLCKLVASYSWPLLEKTVVDGRWHLEGAGQLMTFTRMLQLLPCVFQNLSAQQKKQIFLGAGRYRSCTGEHASNLTWFQEFIRWGEVSSPIIQRWWKEAVVSLLEDLQRCGLVLPTELESMMVDLRKPGLQVDKPLQLQLANLLQTVWTLAAEHKFVDKEEDHVIPFKFEETESPDTKRPGDLHNFYLHDAPVKASPEYKNVIDLTDDSSLQEMFVPNDVIDLTYSQSPKLSRQSESAQYKPNVSQKEVATINKVLDGGSDSILSSTDKGHAEGLGKPTFRRPSVKPSSISGQSKAATLDSFLTKFYQDKGTREANRGVPQVQWKAGTFKPPLPKSSSSCKPQKTGSKLSSLRIEHRVDLEQRAAVEGLVRHQVRERVEREANAIKSQAIESGFDDMKHLKVHAPVLIPVGASGIDPEPRTGHPLDAILRDLVSDSDADPLDAAFDTVGKTRLLIPKDTVLKPKRKLITLEMPGENGRAAVLGSVRSGLTVKPRQVPRLDDWYRRILSMDYLSLVGMSNENSRSGEQLEKVPLNFKSPEQYLQIFRPLVLEEFKTQLQQSHEALNFSDGMTTGVLRLMSLERVDDFQVGRFMAEAGSDGAARACVENELLLLSRQPLQAGPQSCHLLAKVESRDRESKSRATVLLLKLYIQAGDTRLTKVKRLLVDRSKWHVTRLMNISPQLREFQALSSFQSLPFLPILLSPRSSSQDKMVENVSSMANFQRIPEPLQKKLIEEYNESQLKAIAAALGGKKSTAHDDQLTLVQGPPGTGKTKTLVAILSVLLAVKRNIRDTKENESPLPRSSLSGSRNLAIKSSSYESAAMSRVWQDAARAKELMKEEKSHAQTFLGQKQRVLVCAQSNAAVDEIVARICKNGLYGLDGSFFRPSVVRVGTLKSVHPNSLSVFIDTLVDQRLGADKGSGGDGGEDKQLHQLQACRSKLEEVIEFIQVIEALHSLSGGIEEDEKAGQRTGPSDLHFGAEAAKIIAQGDSAVTAKLNLLYRQRRQLTAELVTAEKEGKNAYEESRNQRKAIRKDILRQADVVVTTLSGCGGDLYTVCMESLTGGKKNKPVQDCFFNAVVIDEAAQALEPATLIPLQLLTQSNARCVMVGDPKQLPATVLSQMASRMQYECSMFERLQKAGFPVTMLSTQYRMHPEIRQFPSAHFYDDRITDGENLEAVRKAIFHRELTFRPYVFFDVADGQESRKGGSASQSLSNKEEIEVALQVYLTLKKRYPAELWEGRVGVITPYKQQLGLLREQFGKKAGPAATSDIEFNTVDGFQGREVDILILSTVRASPSASSKRGDIGFVADVRRMNVALTRARFSLWIIGNAATLEANSSWASLLSNARKRSLVFSVRKPYATFFEQRKLVETSHGVDAVKDSPEMYHVPNNKGNQKMDSRALDSIRKKEPNKVDWRKDDYKMSDSSRLQAAVKEGGEELKLGPPRRTGLAYELKVSKDHQLKERSSYKYEEKFGVEASRHCTPRDRVRPEVLCLEQYPKERVQESLHQGGSLSRIKSCKEFPRAGKRSHDEGYGTAREEFLSPQGLPISLKEGRSEGMGKYGGGRGEENSEFAKQLSVVDGKPGGRFQRTRDNVGVRFEGTSKHESQNEQPEEYGALVKSEKLSRDSGKRERYFVDGSIGDHRHVKSSSREHDTRDFKSSVQGSKYHKVEAERDFTANHGSNRKAAFGGQESSAPGRPKLPSIVIDGGEKGRPSKHGSSVVSSLHVPKALPRFNDSKVRHDSSHNKRTTKEELAAARKRHREEIDALLPSGLFHSSKKPVSSGPVEQSLDAALLAEPAPTQRARHPTGPLVNSSSMSNGADMSHEWVQFKKALEESKHTQALDPARKAVSTLFHRPAQGSKPSSDLDNILSGLSRVAHAQVNGSQLAAPSKPKEQGSRSRSTGPKHL